MFSQNCFSSTCKVDFKYEEPALDELKEALAQMENLLAF